MLELSVRTGIAADEDTDVVSDASASVDTDTVLFVGVRALAFKQAVEWIKSKWLKPEGDRELVSRLHGCART